MALRSSFRTSAMQHIEGRHGRRRTYSTPPFHQPPDARRDMTRLELGVPERSWGSAWVTPFFFSALARQTSAMWPRSRANQPATKAKVRRSSRPDGYLVFLASAAGRERSQADSLTARAMSRTANPPGVSAQKRKCPKRAGAQVFQTRWVPGVLFFERPPGPLPSAGPPFSELSHQSCPFQEGYFEDIPKKQKARTLRITHAVLTHVSTWPNPRP